MKLVPIRARITPSLMDQVKALANERGISVAALLRNFVFDDLVSKGWRPSHQEIQICSGEPKQAKRLRVVKPGYVYLLKCAEVYKIGRTRDLHRRFARMSLPGKPRLIRITHHSDCGSVELELHRMFASSRIFGEWFSLSEKDVMAAKLFMANS